MSTIEVRRRVDAPPELVWAQLVDASSWVDWAGFDMVDVVSPTDPAAASQDESSTGVIILAYGAIHAPSNFPSSKVEFCDLVNLTTGHSFPNVPFLIQGAP
jgi:hypothetical protein